MAGISTPTSTPTATSQPQTYVYLGRTYTLVYYQGVLGFWTYAPPGVSYGTKLTFVPLASVTSSSTRTSSGGGGGGGSTLATNEAIHDIFQEYLGRNATATELSRVKTGQWSADHIVRYIMGLHEWEGSVGWNRAAADVQKVWNQIVGNTTVPIEKLRAWINGQFTSNQVAEAIRDMPEYKNGNEYRTAVLDYTDRWEQRIGRPMTDADRAALDAAAMAGWSMSQWDDYIRQNPLYTNGIEYQGKVMGAISVLRDLWGNAKVDELLATDPNLIQNRIWAALGEDASADVLRDWARKEPEYMEGPAAATTRENLIDVYRTIMQREPTEEELTADILAGTTPDQLMQRLRETPEYQAYFAAKPAWMSEQEYVSRKQAYIATVKGYYGDDYEIDDEQIAYFIEHGITPTELGDRFRATEDAVANLANMNYYGAAVGRTFTMDEAIIWATKGAGYGEIAALITKGQNRRAFDEVFKLYTGRMPTVADYEYLETHYVSPNEYSARTAALEKTEQNFGEVDELFMRVYGYHADKDKYMNAIAGGEGSGAYLALIDAAEELDRYNSAYKLFSGQNATPEQLAQWAGIGTVNDLEKRLNTQELVARKGNELLAAWNKYYTATGAPALSSEDLFTVLGQYEGWGAIQAKLDAAMAHKDRQDMFRLQNLSQPNAMAYTTVTQFGGPQAPLLRRPQ